jgi:hypothetical protein
MMATTSMIKGVERVALMTIPNALFRKGAANRSPFALVARKTPRGTPSAVPMKAAIATM